MTGRRAIVGVCLLCALVFSAVAAQGAQAVLGTTAFTCIDIGNGPLWGEHCLASNPGHGETQGWEHVAIPNTEETHALLTNAKTKNGTTEAEPGFLRTVIGGEPVKLKSTSIASAAGATLQNGLTAGNEMFSHGSGSVTFSNVTVVEPVNCAVEGITLPGGPEMITTVPLNATTEGQGMNVKFSPASGTTLTEFKIVNNGGTCSVATPLAKVVGSFKGQPDNPGATITFTEATITGEGTLHFGSAAGPVVGLEGKVTISAGKKPETEPTHAISATTG